MEGKVASGAAKCALAVLVGLVLWSGSAQAAGDDEADLERYRQANVLPAEEVAPVPAEVLEAHLAALANYDEAVASNDPKHRGFELAREAWEPLSDRGDPASSFHLAMLHMFGLGGADFDQLVALRLIESAAEHRHAPAQTFIGLLAEMGNGTMVVADDGLALEWYAHGARGGHCAAVRRLVRAFENGELGAEADPAKAGEWRARLDGCHKR